MEGFIIFSDLEGYSKLSERETRVFYEKVNYDLSRKVKEYLARAEGFNTWGDAVVAVFKDGKDAVDMVLNYRDFFNSYNFNNVGIRKLLPRIGGHFGELFVFEDKLLGRVNMYGSNINTAARIEPVTRTGEIFVTREFKEAIEKSSYPIEYIKFDELGIVELAKNFGERELYRLYREGEKPQVIDKILAMDLSAALPMAPGISSEEEEILDAVSGDPILLQDLMKNEVLNRSGAFILNFAGIYKKIGMYKEAIACIENLESFFIEVDGVKMYPYKYNKDVLKLKANCLTRIGEYGEAGNIVYGLWQSGMNDSDTLAMLAAQYKRRALVNSEGIVSRDYVNLELLKRAKDLYLEAFRRNIEDYYPAINAAYLYRLLEGTEDENGIRLAKYVKDSWINREGENWWMDSTLAEAELLQDYFADSYYRFKQALRVHKPDSFERSAVIEQISIYGSLTEKEKELEPIISILESYHK